MVSAATERPRPIHCRLCSWKTTDPNPAVREEQWQAHYYGVHPQPLLTRCTVPPFCGWSTTAPHLDELRRLKAEHEATHATTTKSKARRRTR